MVTFENVVINKTVENLIKGEDYRGYPYSTNYVNSQRESDGDFSGLGTQPYIIGFYEDSKFEKLIDPNKFISVDESIKEIHVRRAQEHYVPNQMYTGTYKSENLNVVADGRNFDIYFDNIHYKIIGKDPQNLWRWSPDGVLR